jgi:hypothetical protein
MHGTQKRDTTTPELAPFSIGDAAYGAIVRLRKVLIELEHSCAPKRRGRPFLHRRPTKVFDMAARDIVMSQRDCYQHLLYLLDRAEDQLRKQEPHRALETVRYVEFAMRIVTDRVAAAA